MKIKGNDKRLGPANIPYREWKTDISTSEMTSLGEQVIFNNGNSDENANFNSIYNPHKNLN